ncbi:putative helicase [Tetrabaena socialis]|uniref:Putative helicase n=1 Tax=Tetrabaena socialis TaxID=47790 RepID=A0A2J7ZPR0_9CHLO|nr:putative helicase [Tetrabaena socialis]|eukprot:PNH02251.1 putative helicase [Tetrabaena socialis]
MNPVTELATWLLKDYPNDLLMPVKTGTKEPVRPHKNGAWSWELFELYRKDITDVGILLRDLCVADFDDVDTALSFEKAFPELLEAPKENTRKGCHYFFRRPDYADAEGYFDGSRQHSELPVDFKSVCSTGTSGLICVCPSPNKVWVRPPWMHPPQDISRELLDSICTPRSKSKSKSVSKLDVVHNIVDPSQSISREDPVVKLLHLLSKTRWDLRESWMKIAMALKATYAETYRQTFMTLSKISPKYSDKEANKLWDSLVTSREDFEGRPLTMRTIERWAAEDDPIGYSAYRVITLPAVVLNKFKEGDRGLADICHFYFKDIVKRCNETYYYFDDSQLAWVKKDREGLHVIVSRGLEGPLRDLENYFRSRISALMSGGSEARPNVEDLEDNIRHINESIRYIQKYIGMCNVTKTASRLFDSPGFEQTLDSIPHLLGVQNGVVDLRTGELRQRRAADNLFAICPVHYDPDASSKIFHEVILAAMADDEEMARYLQKLLGYGITGEVCQEVFPVFTGSGRNCKGVITQTLSSLLGSLYQEMEVGIITDRQVSNIGAERAKLLGARIALFNELRPKEKLKTNEVQLLSGGDGIPAKALYKDPMTLLPRHLCILSTNHMPELSEVIPAIMERLLCVPFQVTFTDLDGAEPTLYRRQCDTTLKTRLKQNPAAVLKWFVEGAVAWYASPDLKKTAPLKVRDFSRRYFEDQDKLACFIRDRCRTGSDLKTPTSVFLQSFQEHAGVRLSSRELATVMGHKGFLKKFSRWSGGAGVQCFMQIAVLNEETAGEGEDC